jgi:hypothetical protein
VSKLFSRKAAIRVAHRAHRHGVPLEIAYFIAFACRKYRVRYSLGYALFQQESNFEVVYGHDAGGLFAGLPVRRRNYKRFRAYIIAHAGQGANGVGLGQPTYWRYIQTHIGLWKPRVQVYLSLSILADLLSRHDERTAAGAYNGGEGNPNFIYADEVLAKATNWRPELAG